MDHLTVFCLVRENVIWFSHDIEYCIDETDSFHFAVLKNVWSYVKISDNSNRETLIRKVLVAFRGTSLRGWSAACSAPVITENHHRSARSPASHQALNLPRAASLFPLAEPAPYAVLALRATQR